MSITLSLYEVLKHLNEQKESINKMLELVETDTLKYVTRPERDLELRAILDRQDQIDDTLKATVKMIRLVRRARIRDDFVLSKLAQYIGSQGINLDKFVGVLSTNQEIELENTEGE